jgi:hypothetical protein
MDDRFDQILVSYSCDDNEGFAFVEGSYVSYGNDGMHFNKAINEGTNFAVGSVIADALHQAADHLPVYADFQVPAKIDAACGLDFGTVITGASAELLLEVQNIADEPGDSLEYEMLPPNYFGAPAGTFFLIAGDSEEHAISMNTSVAATRSGTLVINSNDLDYPQWNVSLQGTVLSHAQPSLAETSIMTSDTVDFGTHPTGSFTDQAFDVFNVGYCGLQSVLEIYSFELVGSDRFDFADGFCPAEVGSDPATYTICFDDSGASDDSLYTATLSLSTRDDWTIPGCTELDDITLYLQAHMDDGTPARTPDAPVEPAMKTVSANPFSELLSLQLAIPSAQGVTVEIYDVSGSLVKTLMDGTMGQGIHNITWDGRNERGKDLASGLYFVRATVGDWNKIEKYMLLR